MNAYGERWCLQEGTCAGQVEARYRWSRLQIWHGAEGRCKREHRYAAGVMRRCGGAVLARPGHRWRLSAWNLTSDCQCAYLVFTANMQRLAYFRANDQSTANDEAGMRALKSLGSKECRDRMCLWVIGRMHF